MSPTTLTELYETFCVGGKAVPIVVPSKWFDVPKDMPKNFETVFSQKPLTGEQSEKNVQSWMNERLTKLQTLPGATTIAVDTHKAVTLRGRRKPDFTGYRAGSYAKTGFNTVWVGDVKALEKKQIDSFSKEQ
jgi:hypothetical protein